MTQTSESKINFPVRILPTTLARLQACGTSIEDTILNALDALDREKALPKTVETRLIEMTGGLSKLVEVLLTGKADQQQQSARLAFACDKSFKANIQANLALQYLLENVKGTPEQLEAYVTKRDAYLEEAKKVIIP